MPQLTIYVPAELARDVRRHDVPLSAVCQVALRRRVRLAERRAALKAPPAASGTQSQRRPGDPPRAS